MCLCCLKPLVLIMANEKIGNGNGNVRNTKKNLPSWMGSKDKTDLAQDEIATSSMKGGKSSSNSSKVNRKSTAEGETASKISDSSFSKLLDWVIDCYNQKKLVEIDSYLMHAGKPWRKTYLENSASRIVSKTVQRASATKVAASPISTGETFGKNFIAASKVKELALQDLKDTISWLQNQEETPEASEMEKIAAGGIVTCLQDVIEALKENQDVDRVIGDWKFVPRVVRELQKFKVKVGNNAVLTQELYEHALACKCTYEKEFERMEKSKPVRKKLRKDFQVDGSEDCDSENRDYGR